MSHSQYQHHHYPHPHPHLHTNIHAGKLPSLTALRIYLTAGGWLELGPDLDSVKYARAGSIAYVPSETAPNFAGYMRLALLQIGMAEGWNIRLELPAELMV